MTPEARAARLSQHEMVREDVEGLASMVMTDLTNARREKKAIYTEDDVARICVAVAFSKMNGSVPEVLSRMSKEEIIERAPKVATAFMNYAVELADLGIAKGTGGVQ